MTSDCKAPLLQSATRFPRNFVWGVATAAPQIEGAAFDDGKGESIWDRFCRTPGKVANGDTLDVACDHYHRLREDVSLMVGLGVKHYRLSLAWPRIFPDGKGKINPKGIAFYRRLLELLAAKGITPWVTLFHWDLPQKLEERGGWRSRETVEAYDNYARAVVDEFSDVVKHWITLNEIHCFTKLGYGGGDKAPGADEPARIVNQTYHHALLCHGHAVKAVRELGGRGAQVGLTDIVNVPVPVCEDARDIAAARAWFVERNAHLLEPIHAGRYSAAYLKRCGADRCEVRKGDMELISAPTDFLGLNIYTGTFVRHAPGRAKYQELPFPADFPCASSPWLKIVPEAMYWGTRLASEVYGTKAIYITENGCSYDRDALDGGEVNDVHRITYLRNYLKELRRAIGDGVPVRGYFAWSLMDNYEWQDGYNRRFGLVHTDFKTLKRTPKLSALWYSQAIKANGVV